MAFVELKPVGRGNDPVPRVKLGRRKSGRLTVSFNAAAAAKWGLVKGAKLTALADLASTPRVLRLVVGAGPFAASALRKGGAALLLDLPELGPVKFGTAVCAHEEDEDGKGRRMIDVTLPPELQAVVIAGQARPAPAAPPAARPAPERLAPERPAGGTSLEREIASTAAFSHHKNRNGAAARR